MYQYYNLDKIREVLAVTDENASSNFLLSYGQKYFSEKYEYDKEVKVHRKGKTGIIIKTKNKNSREYTRIVLTNTNALKSWEMKNYDRN